VQSVNFLDSIPDLINQVQAEIRDTACLRHAKGKVPLKAAFDVGRSVAVFFHPPSENANVGVIYILVARSVSRKILRNLAALVRHGVEHQPSHNVGALGISAQSLWYVEGNKAAQNPAGTPVSPDEIPCFLDGR
jgi:hypothetical protein